MNSYLITAAEPVLIDTGLARDWPTTADRYWTHSATRSTSQSCAGSTEYLGYEKGDPAGRGTARAPGRTALLGAPTRWFGYVAGTLAMRGVLSLAIYYANPFLPVGRMLSMLWTVVAGIRLRPAVKGHRSSATPEVTR